LPASTLAWAFGEAAMRVERRQTRPAPRRASTIMTHPVIMNTQVVRTVGETIGTVRRAQGGQLLAPGTPNPAIGSKAGITTPITRARLVEDAHSDLLPHASTGAQGPREAGKAARGMM
jgi:hypothetical protein